MTDFQTVVIDRVGGHYHVVQGEDLLLRVPESVFQQFEADSVFPPDWRPLSESHPVRRLFWNPDTREFLLAGLEELSARVAEGHGTSPFRSFLQGLWVPRPPVLLLRPYWNPADPYEPFDQAARQMSFSAQWHFLEILGRLRLPPEATGILNATDAYLEALGVNAAGVPFDGEAIRELSLTPPESLEAPRVWKALEVIATEYAGTCFPLVHRGMLRGAHALCLPAIQSCEALFQSLSISCQEGPFRPH